MVLLLSALVTVIALGVQWVAPPSVKDSAAILVITSLGIGGSLLAPVRRLPNTFQLGMYIILVFCLVVGSMAKVEMIVDLNLPLLAFVAFSVFGSMLLQSVFARLLRVDVDTFLITNAAAIMSPPFVPVVAGALKNREILLSGITVGIIGYAVGNYLGVSLGYLLRAIWGGG